ncbi:MAG: hypothetical protein AAB838_04410 [Patescibacteria group bacterium]
MKKSKKSTKQIKKINKIKIKDPFANGKFNSGDFIAWDREFGHSI